MQINEQFIAKVLEKMFEDFGFEISFEIIGECSFTFEIITEQKCKNEQQIVIVDEYENNEFRFWIETKSENREYIGTFYTNKTLFCELECFEHADDFYKTMFVEHLKF